MNKALFNRIQGIHNYVVKTMESATQHLLLLTAKFYLIKKSLILTFDTSLSTMYTITIEIYDYHVQKVRF